MEKDKQRLCQEIKKRYKVKEVNLKKLKTLVKKLENE